MDTLTLERPVADATPRFTITKNIPIPPVSGKGRDALYPFAQMDIGDSFAAPAEGYTKTGKPRTAERVRGVLVNCARGYAAKHNPTAKFATRVIGNTVRVWRTA
jgi:hypothetical protein